MRVRITRRPPISYDLTGDSLRVNRVYDVPSEFASALIIEGCAEFADATAAKDGRSTHGGFTAAEAHDRPTLLSKPHESRSRSKGGSDADTCDGRRTRKDR